MLTKPVPVFTLEEIKKKLQEINSKGFIKVLSEDFRTDDSVVGQVLA